MASSRSITVTLKARDEASPVLERASRSAKGLGESFAETSKQTRGALEQIGLIQTMIGSALVAAIGRGVKAYAELEQAHGATATSAGTATKALADLERAQTTLTVSAGKIVTESGWLAEMVQRFEGLAGVAGALSGDFSGLKDTVETLFKINPATMTFWLWAKGLETAGRWVGLDELSEKLDKVAESATQAQRRRRDAAQWDERELEDIAAGQRAIADKQQHEIAEQVRKEVEAQRKKQAELAAARAAELRAYSESMAAQNEVVLRQAQEQADAVSAFNARNSAAEADARQAATDRAAEDREQEINDYVAAMVEENNRVNALAKQRREADQTKETEDRAKTMIAAYQGITGAVTASISAVVSGSKSFGDAMQQMLASVLEMLGAKAIAEGAGELAAAASDLAGVYTAPLAAGHFAAAAAWGAAGVAAGVGSAALSTSSGGGGGGGRSYAPPNRYAAEGGTSRTSSYGGSSTPGQATPATIVINNWGNMLSGQQLGRDLLDAQRKQARTQGGRE